MREQIDMRHESLDDGFDVAIKCIITGISPTTISADVMIHSQLVKLFVKDDCFLVLFLKSLIYCCHYQQTATKSLFSEKIASNNTKGQCPSLQIYLFKETCLVS